MGQSHPHGLAAPGSPDQTRPGVALTPNQLRLRAFPGSPSGTGASHPRSSRPSPPPVRQARTNARSACGSGTHSRGRRPPTSKGQEGSLGSLTGDGDKRPSHRRFGIKSNPATINEIHRISKNLGYAKDVYQKPLANWMISKVLPNRPIQNPLAFRWIALTWRDFAASLAIEIARRISANPDIQVG